MLLIINIKYFAVEEQLPVMLLISVIKYLIVMPDVKDLAQAAQGAAAPESVNVVEPTTSVNQPVQSTVDTDNQGSALISWLGNHWWCC